MTCARNPARFCIALLLVTHRCSRAALSVASQTVTNAENDDDDSFCRANGVVAGSKEYVACRKDRDVQRNNANRRADQAASAPISANGCR